MRNVCFGNGQSAYGAVFAERCGNVCRARFYARYNAVFIDGSYGFVGRSPNDSALGFRLCGEGYLVEFHNAFFGGQGNALFYRYGKRYNSFLIGIESSASYGGGTYRNGFDHAVIYGDDVLVFRQPYHFEFVGGSDAVYRCVNFADSKRAALLGGVNKRSFAARKLAVCEDIAEVDIFDGYLYFLRKLFGGFPISLDGNGGFALLYARYNAVFVDGDYFFVAAFIGVSYVFSRLAFKGVGRGYGNRLAVLYRKSFGSGENGCRSVVRYGNIDKCGKYAVIDRYLSRTGADGVKYAPVYRDDGFVRRLPRKFAGRICRRYRVFFVQAEFYRQFADFKYARFIFAVYRTADREECERKNTEQDR